MLKLAKVKRLASRPVLDNEKFQIDVDTVSAIVSNRLHVMSDYARSVIRPTFKQEQSRVKPASRPLLKRIKQMLYAPQFSMDDVSVRHLEELLNEHEALRIVYEFKQKLQQIWQEKSASHEALKQSLQEWCRQAEASGVESLREFSFSLRRYSLAVA